MVINGHLWTSEWTNAQRLAPNRLAALALGCRDDLFSLPAADSLTAWIDDGRFSVDALAETMSRLLHPGSTLMARWAARLSTLLSRSPRHAHAVAMLMPRVEVWPEGDAPRDLARWLEVMLEALTEARLPLPATGARTWLARLSGKSRAATLAARLLALPPA